MSTNESNFFLFNFYKFTNFLFLIHSFHNLKYFLQKVPVLDFTSDNSDSEENSIDSDKFSTPKSTTKKSNDFIF